jgi:hypothetical protein
MDFDVHQAVANGHLRRTTEYRAKKNGLSNLLLPFGKGSLRKSFANRHIT